MRNVFIHKNPDTLRYAIFMKFLILAFIYIQKALNFVLRDVFIYKNPDSSEKARQFALRFFYTKGHMFDYFYFINNYVDLFFSGR